MASLHSITSDLLDQIAEEKGYDRSTLACELEIRRGGPTVQPGQASDDLIVDRYTLSAEKPGQSLHYDALGGGSNGTKHAEFRIIRHQEGENVSIPSVIYSFQFHPMPGCCRFALNRWVRLNDAWSDDLQRAALDARLAIARSAGNNTLFVNTGPSGSASAEMVDEFDHLYTSPDGRNRLLALPTS